MNNRELGDEAVRLREWADDDAAWYAGSVRDPLIQQFTTDSPALTAEEVLAAIVRTPTDTPTTGRTFPDAALVEETCD
jgi:hypothetical protein